MGWFWSSGASSASKAPSPPAQSPPEPKEQSQASNVDPEVAKFLAFFQEDQTKKSEPEQQQPPVASSKPIPSRSSSSSTPSAWFSWPSSQPTTTSPPSQHASTSTPPATTPDTDSEPSGAAALAASLFPTEMNCRQAFDQAWGCQSPVGQWRAVYRYGTARDCSELWSDFWFCMRVKGSAGGHASREEAIRARYAAKAHAKYGPGMPSSEDVWASRDEKVEPGSVMSTPIEEVIRAEANRLRAEEGRRAGD